MSIRPVDFNGMIQNTQEVGNNRASEEHRPVVHQENIAQQTQDEVQQLTHQVTDMQETAEDAALDPDEERKRKAWLRRRGKKSKKAKKKSSGDGTVRRKDIAAPFDIFV